MVLFKPYHVPSILVSLKTETRRTWKRPMVKIGGQYKIKTKMISKEYYGKIEVLDLFQQRLEDMTPQDAWHEGGYTLDEFKDTWIEINGSWDNDTVVSVVMFRFAGYGDTVIPNDVVTDWFKQLDERGLICGCGDVFRSLAEKERRECWICQDVVIV